MTVSKSILTVSTLAIAAMFGGGVYLMMNLNALAKPRIERMASQALGVAVRIGDLEISIKDKSAVAKEVTIANPSGYSRPYAVTVEQADIRIGSLAQGLVTLDAISVDGIKTYVEARQSGMNLNDLKKGMRPAKPPASEEDAVKVIIKRFALSRSEIFPSVTLVSSQDLEPVTMSDVVLNDIGVREGGVLPGEAAKQMTKPILNSAMRAAGNAGYLDGMSSDALKEMGMSQIKSMSDQIESEVDKIGDKLKSLF